MNQAVEIFRGAAALFVLAHHYAYPLHESHPHLPLEGMHFFHSGVDLFFVITGFVFSPYLVGQKPETVAAFVTRRVFRIYPLYLFSLLASSALMLDKPLQHGGLILKHLLFLQTTGTFEEAEKISLVYWTLPVEMEYYLLIAAFLALPKAVLAALKRRARSPYFGAGLCLAFSGLGLALFHLKPDVRYQDWALGQAHLPTLLGEFLLGVVVYQAQDGLSRCAPARRILAVSGLALLCSLFAYYALCHGENDISRPFGWFNLLCALGYAQLMASALAAWKPEALRRWPARAGVWLGTVSYPIYLFHLPVITTLSKLLPGMAAEFRVALGIAATLALAGLAHRAIEAPCRIFGRRLAGRHRPIPPHPQT